MEEAKIRRFDFAYQGNYNFTETFGMPVLLPSMMQDPVDNTTEWLVGVQKLPFSEIKIWKYYSNFTKVPFEDKFEIKLGDQ